MCRVNYGYNMTLYAAGAWRLGRLGKMKFMNKFGNGMHGWVATGKRAFIHLCVCSGEVSDIHFFYRVKKIY